MLELGRYSLWAALFFACAAAGFLFMGLRWDRKDLQRNGYYAVYGFFLTTVIAAAVLLQAFLKKDFGFAYVAENSDASLSTFYRIAGFWAGQQGSFLFWLVVLAIAVIIVAIVDLNRLERLTGGAVAVLAVISAVFAALMVFDPGSNPFLAAEAGAVPFGLNPLLLHPGMVFHPPTLFIGYVGLAVPFAFAISTLLLGRGDKLWVQRAQKWAVFGWLFLSLGIGLGAWWAYVVLSFGGYWAWDPVENTSLVPWLTATALLHSFTLYKARGLFKRWSLGLAVLTFWFTILATWTTRTGLISSVHAFGRNPVLIWILSSFLVVTAVGSIGLIAWRWRTFESHDDVESWLSRDFLYYVTNLLLTLFAVAVAFATVAVPLIFPDRAVGASTYDLVARPLGVVDPRDDRRLPAARLAQDRRRAAAQDAHLADRYPGALDPAVAVPRVPEQHLGLHRHAGVRLRLRRRHPVRAALGAARGRTRQEPLVRPRQGVHRQPHPYRRLHRPHGHGARGRRAARVHYLQGRAVDHRQGQARRDREPGRLHADVQGHDRDHRRAELHTRRGYVRRDQGRTSRWARSCRTPTCTR